MKLNGKTWTIGGIIGLLILLSGFFFFQQRLIWANDDKREKGDKELQQQMIIQYDKLDKKLEEGQKEQRAYNEKILKVVIRLETKLEDR